MEENYSSEGTMLAAVLHNFNDLRVEQVPKPKATEPGDVVVKIRSVGICQTGTQLSL
jgi:threonine dehydrogenase-like Zn-dependent dehydrogenase